MHWAVDIQKHATTQSSCCCCYIMYTFCTIIWNIKQMLFNINIAILFCIIKWITNERAYTHSRVKKCLFCFGFCQRACWLVDFWWMSNLTNKYGKQTDQIWHVSWLGQSVWYFATIVIKDFFLSVVLTKYRREFG